MRAQRSLRRRACGFAAAALVIASCGGGDDSADSDTDGVPDGRWVFINANNTPRVARVDLATFETDEILDNWPE